MDNGSDERNNDGEQSHNSDEYVESRKAEFFEDGHFIGD